MTETWMSRAAERCVALSLDLDKILAAHQIVSCAVGSNWPVEQERLLSQGGRMVADAHRLISGAPNTMLLLKNWRSHAGGEMPAPWCLYGLQHAMVKRISWRRLPIFPSPS